jgi:hypothetical protein
VYNCYYKDQRKAPSKHWVAQFLKRYPNLCKEFPTIMEGRRGREEEHQQTHEATGIWDRCPNCLKFNLCPDCGSQANAEAALAFHQVSHKKKT